MNDIINYYDSTCKNVQLHENPSLEQEIAPGSILQRKFDTYKNEHRMSDAIEALQVAVTGLQQKLDKKLKRKSGYYCNFLGVWTKKT